MIALMIYIVLKLCRTLIRVRVYIQASLMGNSLIQNKPTALFSSMHRSYEERRGIAVSADADAKHILFSLRP